MRSMFSWAALVMLGSAVQAAEGDIVPRNAGFESGEQFWVIDDSTSQISADAARSGSLGLRVGTEKYNPTGSSVTSEFFPLQPGQEIELGFWARTSVNACGVYLVFNRADGRRTGGQSICAINKSDNQWHQYSLKVRAPEDAASVAIWVHSFAGARGVIDIDDISLLGIAPDVTPIPAPPPRKRPAETNYAVADIPRRATPPIIVIKLDDLKPVRGVVHPQWQRVADFLASRKIKSSMGIIANTLVDAKPEFVEWVKQRHESGEVEFWFHGWDHALHTENGIQYNEFNKRSYEQQKKHFADSQKLVQETLGFTFRTFGPPGGVYSPSYDATTARVMQEEPDMAVWLYPVPFDDVGRELHAAGKVTVLDRVFEVNIERAVGVPDSQLLINGLVKYPDRQYYVLQGHPISWGGDRFDEFVKIIDILTDQQAVFMTPSECAAAVRKAETEEGQE